jgi:ribosomal protein L14
MSTLKAAIFGIIMALLLNISMSYAMTVKKVKPAVRDDRITSDKVKKVTSSRKNRIKRISGSFEKIEGNFLYLINNKKYNLRGVKVFDYTSKLMKEKGISRKGRVVELIFMNDILKEVIIR